MDLKYIRYRKSIAVYTVKLQVCVFILMKSAILGSKMHYFSVRDMVLTLYYEISFFETAGNLNW